MKKMLFLPIIALLFASCGAPETEMNIDEVYNTLAIEDGTIAGVSLGDSWADCEKKMTKLHGDFFATDEGEGYPSITHDYGNDSRDFNFECTLSGGKIVAIVVYVADLLANQAKIEGLHKKLMAYYTKLYPVGITHFDSQEYTGTTTWVIPETENKIVMTTSHRSGLSAEVLDTWSFSIDMR